MGEGRVFTLAPVVGVAVVGVVLVGSTSGLYRGPMPPLRMAIAVPGFG